jgi:hypothetical protein
MTNTPERSEGVTPVSTATPVPPTATPARMGWVSIAIAIIFGLLFAFYFYEAISQALQLSDYLTEQNPLLKKVGHELIGFPWVAVGPLLALPFVTYALAFFIGRRRPLLMKIGLFVMGLAVLSAGSLTLESVASQLTRII